MNREFSAYVSRAQFNLSLGKTHMDLLMRMDVEAALGRYPDFLVDHPGLTGLLRRGLIEQAVLGKSLVWKLTVAGELVCALLDEARCYTPEANQPTPASRLLRIVANEEFEDDSPYADPPPVRDADDATTVEIEAAPLSEIDVEEAELRRRLGDIQELRVRVFQERDPRLARQRRTAQRMAGHR